MTTTFPTHDGGENPREAHYCAPPNDALGTVSSAATTEIHGPTSGVWRAIQSRESTYVGAKGVARHRRALFRSSDEVLLFSHDVELIVDRQSEPRRGTLVVHARYDFHDRVSGTHFRIEGDEAFGRAAERAYSEYVIRSFDDELREHGKIHFQLNARESIGVGPAFVELNVGRGVMRLDASQVEGVFVNRNAVEIRATAPSHEGMAAQSIFRIRIEHGDRIHALAVLLQELVGVRMK